MLKKILVANRGEIACRVMATARRMGIRTVAVHSDADAAAKHVAMADEAVRIGPPAATESYLKGDLIVDAAKRTGAEAIHPGYGFLSESPGFVEAVEAAGLIFIGPSAPAIRAMGLKDAAKRLMEEAGVPIVPGYHGPDQDPELLAAEADRIGYPVLIKARAGGGGKGMRLVERPADFVSALESAGREAEASFGDPACLIEKRVACPRHIEIQVFGDALGNVVHFFERDCSLQRRHQKVIEEAPAPNMPAPVRAAMGRAAVAAARAIGYRGAGTVEFIVDGSGELREDGFWFMEMNTRLQVEHPVSEAITGHDFVELQLRIANGEPLPVRQEDLRIDGHALEARVYAEDVPKGFLPATGRLEHLTFPEGVAYAPGSVRVDSGVRPGDEISPWYDPMIAKVIVHGPTRAAALNMLSKALSECRVAGCVTNLEFLGDLSRVEAFERGDVDTGLIGREIERLGARAAPSLDVIALAALGGLGLLREPSGSDPWDLLAGWRLWTDAEQYVVLKEGDDSYAARVTSLGGQRYAIVCDGDALELTAMPAGGTSCVLIAGGVRSQAEILVREDRVSVFMNGRGHGFDLPNALAAAENEPTADDGVIAPMPGLVRAVHVGPGQEVSAGDPILVLEAMKMEHTLRAPRDGVVAEVLVSANEQVTDGALLLQMER